MDQRMDGWKDGSMERWMDQWKDGSINGWMDEKGQIDGWIDGRMDGWWVGRQISGLMDGQIDRQIENQRYNTQSTDWRHTPFGCFIFITPFHSPSTFIKGLRSVSSLKDKITTQTEIYTIENLQYFCSHSVLSSTIERLMRRK